MKSFKWTLMVIWLICFFIMSLGIAKADQKLINAAYDHIKRNAQISGCDYVIDEESAEMTDSSYKIIYTQYCQLHHARKFVVEALRIGDAVGIKVSEITAPSGVRIE
jgi:hypothetical protein